MQALVVEWSKAPAHTKQSKAATHTEHWTAVLEVHDEYQPVEGYPTLLVADDGGGPLNGGPWLAGRDLLRITLRLTAFARGRSEARQVVAEAVEFIRTSRPASISRIENIPAILETRDRSTGAYLASVVLPVVVRPA
jgi:hypothetical protein